MDHFYHINDDITLIKMKPTPRQLKSYFDLTQKNKKILKDCFASLYLSKNQESFPKYIYNKDTDLFAICSKKAGKIIGCLPIVYHKDTATLFYFIDKDFHNQGIMSDIINKMIPQLFKNKEIQRLVAEVQSNNKASAHVLIKNSFSKQFLYFSPYEIYALTRTDYLKKAQKCLNQKTLPFPSQSLNTL